MGIGIGGNGLGTGIGNNINTIGTTNGPDLLLHNPATQKLVGQFPNADETIVNVAVAAAKTAFTESSWSKDKGLRIAALQRMAAVLRENTVMLAEMEVMQIGRPLKEMTVG